MEWGRGPGSDVSESSEEAGGVMTKGADGRTERVKGSPGPHESGWKTKDLLKSQRSEGEEDGY